MGHSKSSEHIDGSQHDSQYAKNLCQHARAVLQGKARSSDSTDQCDTRQGVHTRHQWGMEQAGDRLNNEITRYRAYHENEYQNPRVDHITYIIIKGEGYETLHPSIFH